MLKGYLCIVLHGHLPYVRHPEFDDFLEEDWFYEAVTETYIPLVKTLNKLLEDRIDFRLTISLSPTLLAMMKDPLLQDRYLRHINTLIELSNKEVERTQWLPQFHHLALMYQHNFYEARRIFADVYHKDLTTAFKAMLESGKIEIITCAGTHGYLPLMEVTRESVRAQIKVSASYFESIFGRRPNGIWLPECGYNPGDDEFLKEEGIKFFFTDAHGILHGSPRPKYGVFAPCYCKSGVAAFGRDLESSKQVWSAEEGYPGDFYYREFYRDIGYDLDYEYIKPYIHRDGIRINTGIKYYSITGHTNNKEPYQPHRAHEKAAEHAGNFMFNRERQAEYLHSILDRRPIVVAPYDAELFGHWWYEGPMWLDFLFRKIAYDQATVKTITPMEYLEVYPRNQVLTPSLSSWGWKGYSEVWLEGSNDWIYRYLHKASERMTELVHMFPDADGVLERALAQALREFMLAQASDWPFIMKTGTVVGYAHKRIKDHLGRFTTLYEQIKSNSIDENYLKDLEWKDNIFPNIDYKAHQ